MRDSPIIVILGLCLCLLLARPEDAPTTTMVGGVPPNLQTCRGEFNGRSFPFRCDPLSVVVSVALDNSGRCVVRSMRPSTSPEDGLHIQTLEHLAPRLSAEHPGPA